RRGVAVMPSAIIMIFGLDNELVHKHFRPDSQKGAEQSDATCQLNSIRQEAEGQGLGLQTLSVVLADNPSRFVKKESDGATSPPRLSRPAQCMMYESRHDKPKARCTFDSV